MFRTVTDVANYYKLGHKDRHKNIYNLFDKAVPQHIRDRFGRADGFGEISFCWNWKLLIDDMPDTFNFLEIGVYMGRTCGLIDILSKDAGKRSHIYGVTPLCDSGDQFSKYPNCDYVDAIKRNIDIMGADIHSFTIIKGYSNTPEVVKLVGCYAPFDIVYVDGCHEYDVVISDLKNYSNMLKIGGYIVMDDASLYVQDAFGKFLGHPDTSKATHDFLDGNSKFEHLYAIGHMRVFKKVA